MGAKVAAKVKLQWEDPQQRALLLEKTRATTLERFGVEHSSQSPEVQQKIEATCLLRFGVKNASQSPEIQAKSRATSQKHFGVDYHCQLPERRRWLINLVIERFGVNSIVNSPTWRAAYTELTGVDHPMKLGEHQQSHRKTCEERWGGSPNAHPAVIAKIKKTVLDRYGVAQAPQTTTNRIASSQLRYGVDYPIQDPHIWRTRYLPRLYRLQHHTLPSGRVIDYQGFELTPLLNYLEQYGESDLLFNGDFEMAYTYKGKQRVYHPDFGVKSERLLVEIKSVYTFTKALESTLIAKLSAAMNEGWIPIVEVWTKKSLVARLTYNDILSLVPS